MVNEKRVKLMTEIAIFEQKNKTELYKVQSYFRSDYIGAHLIKNGIRITVAFIIGLLAWVCLNMDTLVKDITNMDIGAFVFRILFAYLIVLCIFLVITYAIFAVRYSASRAELEKYQYLLRKLEKEYENEDRQTVKKMGTGGKHNGRPD